MSALAERQEAFLGAILDDEAALPDGWSGRHERGLAIYRNNYRSSLVEALRSTFERSERLVGETAFRQAAAHHCITHPPSSWTLDLAGAGFAETCADLFANDPDVAELAALEWAMHLAFVARDAQALTPDGFASICAGFDEARWESLALKVMPSVHCLAARYDLARLWSSLGSEESEAGLALLYESQGAIVWREDERPVFVLRPAWEAQALERFQTGETFAQVCAAMIAVLGEETAVAEAGAMLARWIAEGWVEAVA